MPQLIAAGLLGGLVWIAWRALKRQMESVGEELRNKESVRASKSVESLEKGEDGVYRPKQKDPS